MRMQDIHVHNTGLFVEIHLITFWRIQTIGMQIKNKCLFTKNVQYVLCLI